MTAKTDEIVVAFGVDLAYTPHLATTLASIVANAPGERFRFLVIHDGIPADEQRRVEEAAPGQNFDWREITGSPMLEFETRTYISRATYYRFAIPEFAGPDTKRALYIDSDTVVLGNLRELWDTDLGGAPIGAVHDGGLNAQGFAEKWDLPPVDLGYFNAGVLVLDLEQIRRSGFFEQAVSMMQARWDEFEMGDQDVLNLLYWDNWARIDSRWNCQRRMLVHLAKGGEQTTPEHMRATRRPKLVHYTEKFKPWLPDAWHPLTWLYFRYLKRTPYWADINAQAKTSPIKRLRHFIRTQMTLNRLTP